MTIKQSFLVTTLQEKISSCKFYRTWTRNVFDVSKTINVVSWSSLSHMANITYKLCFVLFSSFVLTFSFLHFLPLDRRENRWNGNYTYAWFLKQNRLFISFRFSSGAFKGYYGTSRNMQGQIIDRSQWLYLYMSLK